MPPTPLACDLGGGAPTQLRGRPDGVVVLPPGGWRGTGGRGSGPCPGHVAKPLQPQPATGTKFHGLGACARLRRGQVSFLAIRTRHSQSKPSLVTCPVSGNHLKTAQVLGLRATSPHPRSKTFAGRSGQKTVRHAGRQHATAGTQNVPPN